MITQAPVNALCRAFKVLIFALLVGVPWFAYGAPDRPMILSTHPSYPPIMFSTNKVPRGIALDVATDALKHLNIPYEVVFSGPWNRVLESARAGAIDMVAGLYFSDERATYLDFSVPIMEDPVVLFVWKGKAFPYSSLEDLKGKRGTANLGASFGNRIDPVLKEHVKMQRVVKNDMNYRLLELGRVDFFIFGLYAGKAQAAKLGYHDNIEAIEPSVATEHIYLGISKKSPYANILTDLNHYIKEHINDQRIQMYYDLNLKTFVETEN